MNLKDIKIVVSVVLKVDHGCSSCSRLLCEELIKKYPQYQVTIVKMYEKNFNWSFTENRPI